MLTLIRSYWQLRSATVYKSPAFEPTVQDSHSVKDTHCMLMDFDRALLSCTPLQQYVVRGTMLGCSARRLGKQLGVDHKTVLLVLENAALTMVGRLNDAPQNSMILA